LTKPINLAIRLIRKRLGETGTIFGERFGVRHNTVSQYESGKATPSTSILLKMYRLAETEAEKRPILAELGDSAADLLAREQGFQEIAGRVKNELDALVTARAAGPNARKRFYELIIEILRQPDIPLWLLDLIDLWLQVRDEPDARQTFEEGFSGLWLRVAKLRREKRLSKSSSV
jgi:transcriptional regulator with XRE-family HTH domain